MDPSLTQFYRQYFQQVNDPCYPPTLTLMKPYAQEQIYRFMFDNGRILNLPPVTYQRRTLKAIIDRIQSIIDDNNEEACRDIPQTKVIGKLMERMVNLSTVQQLSPVEAAQQKSIVSYFQPTNDISAPVLIEESPWSLAAGSNVGFRTWEASLRLAYYLSAEGSDFIRGRSVLELGAGAGLLSIICGRLLGAQQVLSTDGNPEVVVSIQRNIALNRPTPEDYREEHVHARHLDWTELSSLEDTLSLSPQGKTKYDTIIGADITYNKDYFVPLVQTISALNKMFSDADIVISGAVRNIDTYNAFVSESRACGFDVSEIPFDCPPFHRQKGFFHIIATPIRIVKLTKRAFTREST
ncbi:hypothetical protein LTS18_008780 [Coniosporium uncinatum]|uniref:Uncharacterized protein n=1 Tax=Coniosporium uncinatum TaxID=93489 RepID=A0ACC3DAK0_9PEZI|nr:hypothetical protein LTS18_008780 [Coniosporium uncinatum]